MPADVTLEWQSEWRAHSRAVGTGVQIVHSTVLQSTKSQEPLRGLRKQLSRAPSLVVQSLLAQSSGVHRQSPSGGVDEAARAIECAGRKLERQEPVRVI